MTELQPVLNIRELPPARSRLRQHLPSLRDLVRPTPHPHEDDLLAYLAQGVVCGIYNDRGLVFDVLTPGRRIDEVSRRDPRLRTYPVQPGSILTDGEWVWSGVLPYYIAIYHVTLPDEFVRHAEAHGWKVDPGGIDIRELNWDAFDAVSDQLPHG